MPRHTLLILLVLGFLKLSAQNTTQFLDATVIINGTSSGLGTAFGGNLGTFSCSQSLSLDGFTATTQQCGNCKTNASVLAYRVNKIGETTANFSFVNNSNSSTLTEATGCLPIVWEKTAYNHNLLNGLSDGIYTLEIYVIAQGENCDNNSAETGRFSANFMVENPLSVTKPSLLATPACRGKNFTLNATTSGATYYEWQKKENGVWQTISGENGAATETISLNFSGIYAPTLFRAVVRNCSNLNEKISDEMEVSPQSPQISVQPINLTNCLGQDVFFKTASPSNTARYQWQWSNNGAGFVNLSATTHYVTPTTNELKLNNLLSGDHEDAFRCIITDNTNGCTDTTQAAMVFVNRKSSILAEESTICEGKDNALTARSLYGNIETYQWQLRNTAGTYENLTESTDFVGVTDQQLHLFSVPKANTHYRVSMVFSAVSMDNNGTPQATTCLLTELKNFIINPRPASSIITSDKLPNRCGAGIIDINAPKDTLAISRRWYADTTTTHLATTELFSPTVTASQSFFLSNIDAKSCESYRTEIPVTVHAVPQLSVETWDEVCPSATSFSLTYNATISDSVFVNSTELIDFQEFKETTSLSSIEIPMPDNPLSDNYHFKIYTKNKATNCTSEEKEFTLKIKEKTSISIDITTDTLCEATPFSFITTATGAGTLGYQWLKNDEEISGETFSSFTKSSANVTDSGNYRCRVTAECGEAISDEKKLTVQPGIRIQQQPKDSTVCQNRAAKFSVQATGEGVLRYQWKKNGDNVGADTNELLLENLQPSDNNATIVCEITSDCGKTLSNAAKLTVISLPEKPIVAATGFCQSSTSQQLTAIAATTNTLFWWETNAAGGTASQEAPTPPTNVLGTTTYYVSQVTPEGCEGQRAALDVEISAPVTVRLSASQRGICTTGFLNKTAKIVAFPSGGNDTFLYEWKNGNGFILPETDSILVATESSLYTVKVTSKYCSITDNFEITSSLSELNNSPLSLNQSVCSGESVTFTATYNLSGGQFRWYDNATSELFVSNNNPFVLPTITESRTYYVSYSMEQEFLRCESPRTQVEVTVQSPILINSQPKSITRCKGNTAKFSVIGSNITAYQWERKLPNGTFQTISGATTKDLSLSNIGNSTNPHETVYRAKLFNGNCSILSDEATLFVNSQDENLDSKTACLGQNVQFSAPATTGKILSYEWQKRMGSSGAWQAITDSTTENLDLQNVQLSEDNTYYRCRLVFDNHDGTTCVITTDDARLTVRDVTLAVNVNHVACFGENSGKITALPAGGSGYSFQLNGGNFQTNPLFEGLSVGNYTIVVKSSEGCSASIDTTISQPSPILLTDIVTQNSSCEGANGSISFSVSGGTGTLFSALSNDIFTESSTFYNLSGGSYVLKIKDQNGCQKDSTITVGGKATPIISTQPISQTDCKGNSVNFSFVATNASQIQWQKQTNDGSFENIQNGNNTILKLTNVGNSTNPDQTKFRVKIENDGCEVFSDIVTLNVNSVSKSWKDTILCIGASYQFDVATLQPKGTILSYQWQYKPTSSAAWNSIIGETNSQLNFTNLTTQNSGYYRCRLVFDNHDGTTCVITTDDARLTVRDVTLAVNVNHVACFGENSGKITIIPSGGSGYSFQLNGGNFQTNPLFEGLSVGNYTIVVKSSEGCSAAIDTAISQPSPILLTDIVTQNSSCEGANGSISFSASGGTGTLLSALSSDIFTENRLFSNLSGGTYVLKIKDQNGCQKDSTITVGGKVTPIIVTQPISQTDCKGNGVNFSFVATNASQIQWQKQTNDGSFENIQNGNNTILKLTNVGNSINPDQTKFRVKIENDGCEVFSDIVTLHVNSTPYSWKDTILCIGASYQFDVATLQPKGTILSYQWQYKPTSSAAWNSIIGEINSQLNFTNLTVQNSGYYRCRLVFDNHDGTTCVITTDDARLTVRDVTLAVNVNHVACFGENSGKITALPSGGSGYSFQLNGGNFQTNPLFEGLIAGNYTITVKSSEGCSASIDTAISQPSPILLTDIVTQNSSCEGANGSISFSVSGGTGTLFSALSNDIFTESSTFSNLSGGSYVLKIKDQNGCQKDSTITVGGKATPVISTQPISQTDCKGNGVNFSFVATNASQIQWQKQNSSGIFENIQNGNNTILKLTNVGNSTNPDQTKFRVKIENDGCEVFSDIVTLNVNSVSKSWKDTILCIGASYQFDVATLQPKGTILSYQWQYKPTSSAAWNSIIGEINSQLNFTNLTVQNSGYYRCRLVFDNHDGTTCVITTDDARLTVRENFAPTITADRMIICGIDKATLFASGCNGIVRWSNGVEGAVIQTDAGTFSAQCNAYGCLSPSSNSVTIQTGISPTKPIITANKTFLCGYEKAILIASGCTGTIAWSNGNVGTSIEVSEAGTYTAACETSCGQSEPSNAIQIQKNNLPTAGTITTSKAPNCVGYNPPEIENTTSPTGSPFVVSWEQKTTSSDWVLIPNATQITFNPTTLSETTYFRRLVVNSCGQAISSPDSIVILPDPTLHVNADKTEVCSEETLQLSAQQRGGAGNCIITWQKNRRSNAPTSSYWETLSDTDETITLSNLTNTGIIDSTVHFRAIIDCNPTSCNKFTSSAISVKILPKSKISLSVKDTTVCKNSTVLVVASGCSGQYFWSNGATTPSIEVSPTTSERYVVSCTTSCGIAKDSCFVQVDDTVLLPPVSTTPSGVVEPTALQFSATGTGLRWYTSATSTEFSSVAPSHSSEGNYSYWVAQSNGICVSSRTKITAAVYKPLAILEQPTNQFDCKGNGVDFSVNARGAGAIRYQWQRKLPNSITFVDLVEGESGIKFPTSALLKVSNVGSLFNPHLAVYRCIVSDSLQTITSNEAQLNVNSLQGTFPNIELCIGKNYEADISEKFIITGNISAYQWQSRNGTSGNWNNVINDTRVQGSETKKLIISSLRYDDAQYYRCVVSFQTGGIVCNEATDASRLTVGSYPNKPTDFSVEYCQFEKAKKMDYDSQNDVLWYEENQVFGNEKAPTPPTHEARKITYFYTEITDEGCESEKGKITVQVHEEPKPPISTTPSLVKEGTPLVFSAEGKNLKWFTSRTGKTFTTNAPVYSLPKTYSHYVSQTSEFGCESERTFISAMIRQTLSILQLPTNQADCKGNSVSFAVKAEGWGAVSYQWQRKRPNENDFSNIPNETASKISIKDVGSAENPDATLYRCIVQDSESELVSTPAQLIVNSIEGTLSDRIICEGEKLIIDNKSLKINGLPIKYEWQKQEGRTWISVDSSENNWQNQGITKPEMTGDYRLKITFRVDNKTTCNRSTKEMKLTVNKVPDSPDSSLYSYCKNSTFLPNLLPASSKNTILWYASKSDTIPLAEPFKNLVNNAILFAATKDNKQCKSPKSRIEINVLPSPPPPITDSLLRYCLGAKTQPLAAKSAVSLQWFNEEETALTQVPTPKTSTEVTQIFFVAALDSNGCQSEKRQITIEIQPCLAEFGTTNQENCTEISIEKVSGRKWFTFTNDAGQAFAAVNPNGLNLGKVTLNFKGYRQSPITQNGIQILPRYFNFHSSVTDNFSNEISLKLFFSENEIPIQNSPQIIHYEGINEDCSFENNNNFEQGESVVLYKNIRLENQFTYKAIAFETTSFSEFGVSYSLFSELRSELSVLPKNAVKIQWNVTKNQQPLAYGIQRSTDKKTWQTWQWIPAEKTSYEIIDEQPIDSISYYRIVFRNTDGTLKYFDSMKAQLTDNQPICRISPNPISVTSDLPLYVRGLRPKTFELLDLQGKGYEISVQNTENSHYRISPKRPLAASSYFLRVTDREGNHCIAKFVSF